MFFFHFDITLAELPRLLGFAGFILYVANYLSLSMRFVTSECLSYFVVNTLAASLVLVSLTHDFNMASLLIQVFWISIGVCAIGVRVRRRTQDRKRPQAIG
ncbi:CBU_0592 family membrane protein [Mesobacterium pallidum]|uniref:CBU_0592 family membrane protein n=1 Tax=Mesobacterium pallidum TaxID=2872037 RepID=UPI001EE294C4|nr:hypothetical protein [Mesobacterium pallidum]